MEIKTLYEIKKGFEDDLFDIEANIQIQQSAMISGKILLTHLRNKLQFHDSLKFHFANSGMFTIFVARTGPFETLKTRGLDIISNDSIRLEIAYIYDYNYEYIIAFQERGRANKKKYYEYLLANFKDINLLQSASPINYAQLMQDIEFINLINANSEFNSYTNNYYMYTESKINSLIKKIETEIKRLKTN